MNLRECRLRSDENIDPDVVAFLRAEGFDVQRSTDLAPAGSPDAAVLKAAHDSGRVVVTHERDFGALVMPAGEPFTGIPATG